MNPIVFTTATVNRLAGVRVLFASVRRHLPDARCVLVLVDASAGRFEPAAEPFEVIEAGSLGIPRWRQLAFRYVALEWACALKPFAAAWLLAHDPDATVIYADSDTAFFAPPHALLTPGPAMVVVPHRLSPAQRAVAELTIRLAGQYNAGMFAVRNGAQPILSWWAERVTTAGFMKRSEGQFADQGWLDFIPVWWPTLVGVLADPGYDVAHWNLDERILAMAPDGTWTAGGAPLVLLHASGFDPFRPETVSRHAPGLTVEDLGEGAQLFRSYARELLAAGWATCIAWECGNDRLSDGNPVYGYLRSFFAEEMEASVPPEYDPFDFSSGSAMRTALLEPVDGCLGTRFTMAVYRGDHRAQARFPRVPGVDEAPFLVWSLGVEGMEVEPYASLLAPIRKRLADLLALGLDPSLLTGTVANRDGDADLSAVIRNADAAVRAAQQETAHAAQETERFRGEIAERDRQILYWRTTADYHIRLAQNLQVDVRALGERLELLSAEAANAATDRLRLEEIQSELSTVQAGYVTAIRRAETAEDETKAAQALASDERRRHMAEESSWRNERIAKEQAEHARLAEQERVLAEQKRVATQRESDHLAAMDRERARSAAQLTASEQAWRQRLEDARLTRRLAQWWKRWGA